jgi:hypothetical protein
MNPTERSKARDADILHTREFHHSDNLGHMTIAERVQAAETELRELLKALLAIERERAGY